MKYIRTKDGMLFEVVGENENFFIVNIPGAVFVSIYKDMVVDQADQIDHLFDEIVAVKPLGVGYGYESYTREARNLVRSKECMKTFLDMFFDNGKGYTIYGSIWTEWGRKHVAKLNDGDVEYCKWQLLL